MQKMKLILEDGTEIVGQSFGSIGSVTGEVVFNTAMAGYIETLTDPSYCGQILVCTYPLVGSYGVPPARQEGSLEGPYESDRIQVMGLVVQQNIDHFSHHSASRSLSDWLREEDIPAITGADTRTLTRRLREHGTITGWIVPDDGDIENSMRRARKIDMTREVFDSVTTERIENYGEGRPRIMLVDVGAKDNIVRSLVSRGASVLRVPWSEDIERLAGDCDGIVLGNGPGDPMDLVDLIAKVRGLLSKPDKPLFGICLGNQLLSLAAGARTYKLAYGHRGVNQPVRDLRTGRCYITNQNHGYAVDDDSLPEEWEPWFVNLNDGTNEGIRSKNHPFFSVQFHPEASPGCWDTAYLFDDFLELVGSGSTRS